VRQHTQGVVRSDIHFIANFLLFSVVKEFWKLVEIWRSYRHLSLRGILFIGTR